MKQMSLVQIPLMTQRTVRSLSMLLFTVLADTVNTNTKAPEDLIPPGPSVAAGLLPVSLSAQSTNPPGQERCASRFNGRHLCLAYYQYMDLAGPPRAGHRPHGGQATQAVFVAAFQPDDLRPSAILAAVTVVRARR